MAFWRSTLVYISPGGAGAGAGAGVGARETAGMGAGVPLPSVGAPPVSLSSLAGGGLRRGLRRVHGPTIADWLGGVISTGKLLLLPNGLADPLGLKLLEL